MEKVKIHHTVNYRNKRVALTPDRFKRFEKNKNKKSFSSLVESCVRWRSTGNLCPSGVGRGWLGDGISHGRHYSDELW